MVRDARSGTEPLPCRQARGPGCKKVLCILEMDRSIAVTSSELQLAMAKVTVSRRHFDDGIASIDELDERAKGDGEGADGRQCV